MLRSRELFEFFDNLSVTHGTMTCEKLNTAIRDAVAPDRAYV